jgi:hypothetical protein
VSVGANIISAIQNLRMAKDQFEDFIRQYPKSSGERLFKKYIDKIDWIFSDIITIPSITDEVRIGIRKEIASDVFAVPAIVEKVSLLSPEQREMIEDTIDAMLAGEEIKIVDIKDMP